MNKLIIDKSDIKDRANISLKGTKILLINPATGKTIFRGSNRMLVSGSEFNAIKDFNFSYNSNNVPNFNQYMNEEFLDKIPSYDKGFINQTDKHPMVEINEADIRGIKGENNFLSNIANFTYVDRAKSTSTVSTNQMIYEYFQRRIYLFCVGIDGCGIENSRVYKVQNTKWIAPFGYARYDSGAGTIDANVKNCLIPFRWVNKETGESGVDKDKYFGRSVFEAGTYSQYAGYYFKSFDASPILLRRYEDDSSNLSNIPDVWKEDNLSDAEVVVQLRMSIKKEDCREYFNLLGSNAAAKINCISLCTAVPYTTNTTGVLDPSQKGQVIYRDIRPFTRFNFPNEALIEPTKEIDIVYYLYY